MNFKNPEDINLDPPAINNYQTYNQSSPLGSIHTNNNPDGQSD